MKTKLGFKSTSIRNLTDTELDAAAGGRRPFTYFCNTREEACTTDPDISEIRTCAGACNVSNNASCGGTCAATCVASCAATCAQSCAASCAATCGASCNRSCGGSCNIRCNSRLDCPIEP